MGTRFYFDLVGVPEITPPTPASAWEDTTTSTAAGRLVLDPVGDPASSSEQVFVVGITAALNKDILLARFVSQQLAAQTLSGTFTLAIALNQGAANQDSMLQVVIRVVDAAGTTVRGTAYAGQTATTVASTVYATNAELKGNSPPSSRVLRDIVLSNVNVQNGDRLVVEVGARTVQSTNTVSYTLLASCSESRKDMTAIAGKTQSSPERGWLEFSQTLFAQPGVEEYKFTQNGTTLNTSPSVPFVDLESVDGIDNAPVSSATQDREGVDGGFVSSQFESFRTVTLEGIAYASPTALESYLDTLKANFAPTRRNRDLLFGTDAGDVRVLRARSQGMRYAKNADRRLGKVGFQVQLLVDDPRLYEPTDRTLLLSPSSTAQTLVVPGNRDTPANFSIAGPVTGLSLTLRNQYGIWVITYSGSLAAEDVVDVNTDTRMIIRNTNTNYRSIVTFSGGWVNLAPGTNLITFNATSSPDARCLLTYRGAYR